MVIIPPRGLSVDNIPNQDDVSVDKFKGLFIGSDAFDGVPQDCTAIVGEQKFPLRRFLRGLCTELREYKPDVSYQDAWISGVADLVFRGDIVPEAFRGNCVLEYAYFDQASGIGKGAFKCCPLLAAVMFPVVESI
jgi:hypothetical protein